MWVESAVANILKDYVDLGWDFQVSKDSSGDYTVKALRGASIARIHHPDLCMCIILLEQVLTKEQEVSTISV